MKYRYLYLAGAAGVGKTTVAKLLSRATMLPYHSVEAKECWELGGDLRGVIARQACFMYVFSEMMWQGHGVYDNHLLSVAGYAVALGVEGMAVSAMPAILYYTPVILLTARPETLRERIEKRMKTETDRRNNLVEEKLYLHTWAQQAMIEIADTLDIPVIDTTNKTPEQVAHEIAELIGLRINNHNK